MAAESWSWSWSWPLLAWISPGAALFLFFNVIVGAVAVLSWGQQGGRDATVSRGKRFTRSASSMVMERLRSVPSSFSFHSAADYGSITPPASQLHPDSKEYYDTTPVMSMAEPGPLAAAGESRTAAMAPPSASVAAAAAEDVRAAPSAPEGEQSEAESGDKMHICLHEVRAVAPRRHALALRSPPDAAAEAAATVEMPPRKREPAKVSEIVPRRAYAEVEGKAEVNARAERFIRQFREDLKLERLNSILRYSRCAGAAPAQ